MGFFSTDMFSYEISDSVMYPVNIDRASLTVEHANTTTTPVTVTKSNIPEVIKPLDVVDDNELPMVVTQDTMELPMVVANNDN